MEERGYIQVYTGSGKGKTTAALGLTVRAVGAGYKVFIGQFLKQHKYSEHKAIELLGKSVTLRTWGGDRFIGQSPGEEDIRRARCGMAELEQALTGGKYDVVIADEINVAVHMGLIEEDEVLALMKMKPDMVELVLTGRYATRHIIDAADLVTEMVEDKHYYSAGVKARKGIEK